MTNAFYLEILFCFHKKGPNITNWLELRNCGCRMCFDGQPITMPAVFLLIRHVITFRILKIVLHLKKRRKLFHDKSRFNRHWKSLPFHQKTAEQSNQGEIVWQLPWKYSGKLKNCSIFQMSWLDRRFRKFLKKKNKKQQRKNSITEISGKKFSKMWVCFVRLSSFPEIPGNFLSLATGKFRKFKPESLVERKALSARSIANTHIWMVLSMLPIRCYHNPLLTLDN